MRFKHLNSAVVYNSVNLPPEISGIQSAYTLTQGQNTVITAAATDPEGDAITWSYNEVRSGANYVVVGAHADDDKGSGSGSVYVYDTNDLSATPTKLTAFDGAAGNVFGVSVATTSDKIIVGASGDDDNGSNSGSVYVYDINDLSATPTKLTAFDGEYFDHFGCSVAANSDKIVVGARYEDDNGSNSGSVYVYDINNLSDQPTKLMGFNSPDRINNVWWHSFDTSEHDSFGVTVAATSDKIIVGAIYDDDNASNAGAIYVFDANDLSAEPAKLTAFDGFTDIQFGQGIAVTDDKIIVGAVNDDDVATNAGAVYVYNINDLSSTPTKLTAYDGAELDNFGIAIAATTDKIVVGAYRDDDDRGSVYVYDANNLSDQPTKLTPHDGSVDDYFGISVAVTDDKVFVGCHFDDDGGSSSGSVYVYDLNDLSLQPTKLTAFDGAANDTFGRSVVAICGPSALNGVTVTQSDNVFTVTPAQQDATFTLKFNATDSEGNVTSTTSDFTLDYVNQAPAVSGIDAAYTLTQGQNTVITAAATDPEGDAITWSFEEIKSGSNYVIVNAFRDDDNGFDSGSVYVYDANDLSAQPTKLTAFDGAASDYFGRSVATAADKIIVGATGDNDNGHNSGSVYVYDANDLSAQPTKLTAFDGAYNDHFGISVAATADKIVVGAMWDQDNGSMSGSVYVYDANDLSASPTKLTAFDGAVEDWFGYSVAATDDKIIVGAFFDDDKGSGSGSVYVYDANDLSAQPTKLTAFDGAANDVFSGSVAATSDKIIVGAYADDDNGSNSGSVYVYDANNLSAQPTKLTAFDGAAIDQFGWSIAAIDDKIFVSAAGDESNSGSIYVYDANDLSAQPTKLTAFDGAADDRFGYRVAATADKIVVGAYLDDDNGSNSGSVYVFDTNDLSAQPTKLTAFDGAEGDQFGYSVAAISAPSALNGVTVSQSDNVFTITPGTADSNFQLRITATDSEGNATSVTPTFNFDYVNQAPAVSGIESSYTLTQGQNTVITAAATDPEGDAITWSFEEVKTNKIGVAIAQPMHEIDLFDLSGVLYKTIPAPRTSEFYMSHGHIIKTNSSRMIVGDWASRIYGEDNSSTLSGGAYLFNASGDFIKEIFPANSFDWMEFGYSVDISENRIVVGSYRTNSSQGSAYVYDIDGNFLFELTAYDGQSNDQYGQSVACNNNYILVIAPVDDTSSVNTGSAYLYHKDGTFSHKLSTPSIETDDYLGSHNSICMTDNRIAIQVQDDDKGYNAGAVYLYDGEGSYIKKITAWDGAAQDNFGYRAIDITDEYIVIGSGQDDGIDGHSLGGSVYVFDINGNYIRKITANDPDGGGFFGNHVSAIGDNLFVTRPYDSTNSSANSYHGSVYQYQLSNGSFIRKILNHKGVSDNETYGSKGVTAFDLENSNMQDVTVTQSDNVFTVTPGTADANFQLRITATDTAGNVTSVTSDFDFTYVNQAPSVAGIDAVYTLTQGQDTVITASATDPEGDAITWSYEEVKSGTSYVVVSATGDDDNGSNSGSVYVYDANDLSAQPTKLTAFDGAVGGQQFGYSVTFSADKIVVGAVGDNDNGTNSGSVYVYDANDLSAQPTKLTAFDGAVGDSFGVSVATTSDKIFVGASATDQDGNNSGSVYVYDLNDLSATPTELTAFDGAATEFFGNSIAATSDKVIVGAYGDESNSGAVYVYDANDLSAQPTKLTAYDGAASDFFGYRVAAAADNIVVSAHADDDKGSSSGSVYVFDANDLSAQPTKLTAFDGAANDTFGYSIAATSDKIIVGAHQDDDNATNSGSVYVFDANDLSAQPTKLTAFDPIDYHVFGQSVSATDDKIFVGAGQDDDNATNSGAVYVFDANDLSATPTKLTAFDGAASDFFGNPVSAFSAQSALNGVTITQSDNVFTITPGTADANFQLRITATDSEGNATSVTSTFDYDFVNQAPSVAGIDAAYTLTQGQDTVITAAATDPEGDAITWSYEEVISGANYVVVGAYADDDKGSGSGSVYVYDANDLSAQPTKLTAFDGAPDDGFGASVAATADKIVVGAYLDDDNGSNSGSVYVFDTNDLSATPTKLTAFDGAASDFFGSQVAATANNIVVGAYGDDDNGSVYVYDANDLSASPTKLTAFDAAASDRFGSSVAVINDKIFVGAWADDDNGSSSGSVYVYDMNDLSASPTKLTAFDGAASDRFGRSIAAIDDKIFVGAPYDDDNGSDSGSVYVFDVNDLSAQPTKLTAFDGAAGDQFGTSFAVTADKIIVSAYADDDNVSNSGSVYVFDVNDLSAQPTKLTAFDGAENDYFGYSVATNADKIIVGAYADDDNGSFSGSVYVYDANDLSATPTKLTAFDGAANDYFGLSVAITPTSSALNGVTVTQSDNVFTVTPGTADANFQLRITATDSEGNVTSTTSDFTLDYVNQAPSVTGIDAAYTLTQGQDTVITAAATDPEGDAITWSYEEVMSSGANYVVVGALFDGSGSVYVYDLNDLSATPIKLTAFDGASGDKFGDCVVAASGKIFVSARGDDDNGSSSGSVYVYDANDLSATPTKLTAFDGAENDLFGQSIAADADKVVVGAWSDDDNGSNSGSVYVYDINDLSAQPTKLTAFDGAEGDQFGFSVATINDKIVVSAYSDDDNGSDSGSVYVFDVNDLSAQPTKLTAFDDADLFGYSVAAINDKIVVGTPYNDDNGTNTGAVYVFDANDLSAQPTKLTAFDGAAEDYFGIRVAATSDKIVVGANYDDDEGNNSGSVYVYDTNNLSAQPTKLTAFDGAENDFFGVSVAAAGDKIFVSATGDDDNGSSSGSVYVYDANDLSAQPTKLTAFDGVAYAWFGNSVAQITVPASSKLNGTTVTQSDNVFTVTPGSSDANFQLRITATDSEGNVTSTTSDFTLDYVNQAPSVTGIDAAYTLTQGQDTVITAAATDPEGDAVTWSYEEVMSGSRYIAVTADADDDVASSSGSVYVYDSSNLSAQPIKLSNPEPEEYDRFGYSVSISQNKLVVGVALDDNPEVNSGSVYVYDLTDLSAAPIKLEEGGADDRFGNSVATNSNYIFITSPNDDDAADDAGAVYVYDINDLSATPTKLTPDNSVFGNVGVDGYAASIDADDNYMVVGAYDDNSFEGAAYVYDVSNLSATPTKLTQSGSRFMGSVVRVFDDVIIVGSQSANSNAGEVYVYDANNLGAAPTVLEANDGISGMRMFGSAIEANSDYIFVGAYAGPWEAFYRFDRSDLSAAPVKVNKEVGDVNDGPQRGLGSSIRLIDNSLFVGATNSNTVFVYDATDLSVSPTAIIPSDAATGDRFGYQIAISSLPSGLNGVTVTQSDNVFTVTPGQQDATFTLAFKATDSEGNVTSVSSDFTLDYVNQAPAVSGIDAAYILTQGQDTVITGTATDPEGDAITWSFEEVMSSGANYVVVGAYGDESNSGSVYVYDTNDLSAQPTKLTAFDGAENDDFGYQVAASGDKIIVGASSDDDNGSNSGSVYVYDINDLSATPTKLTAFDGAEYDYFGNSVAVTTNKIVVGAYNDDDAANNAGAVYVYDVNDLSAQPIKLTPFDGAADDRFGYSVAATADKIVVGAYLDDDNGTNSGSIYVYDANDLSAQPTKLTAFDGAENDRFGQSVATSADKVVVGAWRDDDNGDLSGSVYVYDINDLSATPTKLTAFDGAQYDQFGVSVAVTNDKIFVGANSSDDDGSNSGSVYVYDANDLSAQPTKMTAPDAESGMEWGSSISCSGDNVIIGTWRDNNFVGSVYVYDANDLSATPTKLTAFDGAAGDRFGQSVAAISAPSALNGTTVTQSDNVFTVTPAQQDATFQLTFKATDSEGNVTSVSSDFTLDYVNQAPAVSGIESSYLLSAGGDAEVITAAATDPEGDTVTWSFEEVLGGSSGYVVVSAIGDDGYDGSVYIYNSSDLSATPTKLDSPSGSTNFFGRDFEIVGGNLIVTADNDDTLGNDAGAAFVYDMTDLSAAPTKITAPDGASGNKFGYSVTSSSDKVIISSRMVGKVYVYDANDLTATPTVLTGETNDFGDKVTSNSNYIFVSDPFINHGGDRTGSVYVYDIDSLSLVTEIEHQASGTAYFGKALSASEGKLAVGGWIAGLVYVYDLNNLSSTPETTIYGSGSHRFGISVGLSDNKLVVGASDQSKAYVYDLDNLPEYANYQDDLNPNSSFYLGRLDPTNEPTSDDKFGYSVSVNDDNIVIGAYGDNNNTGSTYVYDANDLSATPTILTAFDGAEGDYYGSETVKLFVAAAPSALNGTTVTQSDNVFTVTPGSEATSFSMRFTATDSEGNVTSTTSDFTVEAAPEPQMGDLFIGSDGYSTGDFNNESEVDAWTKTSNTSWLTHRSGEGGYMEMGWGTDNQVGGYIELDVVPNTEYTISFSGTATSGAPVGHANYRDAYVNVHVVDSEPVGTNASALILQTTPSTTGGTYPNGSTASNGWQPQTSKSGYQTLSGTITPHGSKLTIQLLNVNYVVQYFDDFSVTGLIPV